MTPSSDTGSGLRPSLLRWLRAAWSTRRRRLAAERALQALSEHELKDLGIGRSEIPALARMPR
ncbi:DUF1127 domain-containing protein [Methylibium petroleiphilum]|uniref:YjiS-like domain-containing protein n=1 Tax=Methylibium petroleiphilum (strain ATCC BAA-1232 / LMG 22953 / PM1) TaxID=420662 RepID=A2SEM0_METPP|nr:DUF1127 domain-containing protein [Methylibium petroleiphilum]ABM94009.1 hypothetical protein Mpe_A1048 [Methylibium petroleiphilum PM1]